MTSKALAEAKCCELLLWSTTGIYYI